MRRILRRLSNLAAAGSLTLSLAAAALWVRTEAIGRTDTLIWGRPGVYRCVEFSGDDVEYKALHDPGLPARPPAWVARRGGWARPPGPSNPAALPATSATWILPQPRSAFLAAE